MGEITRDEATALLRERNPRVQLSAIVTYLDACESYFVAQANIAKHGDIVLHPRTGAPIRNPYIDVKAAAYKILGRKNFVGSDEIWARGIACKRDAEGAA